MLLTNFDQLKITDEIYLLKVPEDMQFSVFERINIFKGDVLVVELDLEPSVGNLIIVQINKNNKLRRYVCDGDEKLLISSVANIAPEKFDNSIKVVGVVKMVQRFI